MTIFFKRPYTTKAMHHKQDTSQYDTECHLIFRLPEIVEQIIQHLVPDPLAGSCAAHKPGCSSSSSSSRNTNHRSSSKMIQDVLPLLFVNWLWHDCVSRYTWRHISFEDSKSDYDHFIKFAGILTGGGGSGGAGDSMSALTSSYSAAALAVGTPSSRCDQQIVKRSDSSKPLFPTLTSMIYYNQKQEKTGPPSTTDTLMSEFEILSRPTFTSPLYASTYQNRIRSLTLRKIKERNINDPLQHIGYHVPHLTTLDIYICDYVTNTALYPFLEHGQLTYLSLAGCQKINDEAILQVAATCPKLEHLDLRACGHVSDTSIASIAVHCPQLRHLNVGRVKDRQHITDTSIELIAKHTQVSVLGLAGCDITDTSLILLATLRPIERVSINNCYKVTDQAVRAFAMHCPKLSVFEMKECHKIRDWETVAHLVKRKVLLTLCDQQSRACKEWAKRNGLTIEVQAPIK